MALVAECVRFSRVNVGTDNMIVGETSPRSGKEEVIGHIVLTRAVLCFSDNAQLPNAGLVREAKCSWPAQEYSRYQLWPSPNLPGSSTRVTAPEPVTGLTRLPLRSSSLKYGRGAQALRDNAQRPQAQDGPTPSRRKRSVPGLGRAALTTVQEATMDSRK